MKTKLTLTVHKTVINAARKRSRSSGKSISGLFEEVFKEKDTVNIQTEQQRAATRLLKLLNITDNITTQDDQTLLKMHIRKKYA